MSPCADDSVSVGQALGAQGDPAFQEYGEYELSPGQTEVEVTFDYQKESSLYVFEYLYIKGSNTPPDAIIPVPFSQDTRKFKVKLSGATLTENSSFLVWRVKIPDPLRVVCEGNGPQYAIIPVEQHGSIALVNGQDFIIVTFAELMPNTNWNFEMLMVRKAFSEAATLGFVFTETSHTTGGFTLAMSGAPDSSDYTLHWQVRGLT